MVYQITVEYDGDSETFREIYGRLRGILESISSKYVELPGDINKKGYGTDFHLLYSVGKKGEAEEFRDIVIRKGLAKTVHIDEINILK